MTNLLDPELVRQFEKLPPHDIEAEMCLIGSMMLCGDDRDLFTRIRCRTRREFFYQADHQILFDVVCKLDDAGSAIDAVIVRDELRKRQILEECGGTEYLAAILGKVPSAAHGPHYADIVREKSLLRGAIAISNDILRTCYGPSEKKAHAIIEGNAQRLIELATTGTTDQFILLYEAASKAIDKKLSCDLRRIPTGLRELDDITGGTPLSKFTLIAGRPGMGKSQLCKQIALNAAMAKIPAGVITVEESEGKVAENMIANLSGIENRRIAYGQIAQEEWGEIGAAINRMKGVNFWINDRPTKLSEVAEAATTAKLKHGCQLIIVDYLQLINPDEAGENETREITQISHALKGIAKRLDVAMIAACQLNRGNEMHGVRPPTMRDLRGSGALEQDGDLIILLHRPDYYLSHEEQDQRNNQVQAIIAKNKDGPTGTVPLFFDAKTQRISDWHPHEPPTF